MVLLQFLFRLKDILSKRDNAKDKGFVFEDINQLEKLIAEKIEEKRNPLKSNGAQNAADIIKDLLL